MKKIDKLILGSFIGPFILTFLVVVFILLTQHMLKYFDDIIGKDLGWDVLGQLLFYFAVFMTPVAMPLAVLLSALITFGNLGEHFELTAIKSSGISLLRTLRPIFVFVLFLTGIAFYTNNNLVPRAALEAYSLLWDIRHKKPALDLREGTFYNGIPDVSIKVDQKLDEFTLKNVIVYDHRKNNGNKEVTVADSGRMTTILNERYLKFELFDGYNYTEGASEERQMTGQQRKSSASNESLTRSKFDKTQLIFDLSSFQLSRTDKKWFEGNRIMRNLDELEHDIDSIRKEVMEQELSYHISRQTYFNYYSKKDSLILPPEIYRFKMERDSIARARYLAQQTPGTDVGPQPMPKVSGQLNDRRPIQQATSRKASPKRATLATVDSVVQRKIDSVFALKPGYDEVLAAANMARQAKTQISNINTNIENYARELATFQIQWHKIIASSLACIAMFLIGAPLGAIIKRGGLGVPFLVSIIFFIIYYLLTMQGEKFAKRGLISPGVGVWAADVILFLIGLVFLQQARIDARLFDADFYRVLVDRFKRAFRLLRPAKI